MKTLNFPTSACRLCRHYQTEGRRGGMCQQLGVPVRASWKACSLALPPFAPSWESIEGIWQDDKPVIKEAPPVRCSRGCSKRNPSEEKTPSLPEKLAVEVALV